MFNTNKLGLAAILLTSTFFLSACQEDPEQAANALFITATQTVEAAGKITGQSEDDLTQRVELTEEALATFDKIVADYPQSSVAVKIVSEGKVGNVDITQLKAGLSDIKVELACFTDKAKCISVAVKKKFDGVSFNDEDDTSFVSSQVALVYAVAGTMKDFDLALARVAEPERRASALMMTDRLNEAEEALGEFTAENSFTAALLAQRYLEVGQVSQAAKLATTLLEVIDPQPDKEYDFSWEVLAEVLAKTGQKEKALQVFEAILTAGENAEDYVRMNAVAGGLVKMAQTGFSEEAKKNSARLRALHEAEGDDTSVALARMACTFKEIGDAAGSEQFMTSVRLKFQQANVDDSARWAVNWLLNCDIREAFVVAEAEKIIADPAAYGVTSEEEQQIVASELNWYLGNKNEAITALGDAIELHEIDLERGYESYQILSLAQGILNELKKAE